MDYYPQHSSQMLCAPQYGPSFQAVPPQMKVDPAGYSIHYESWPYGGSHGYPHPAECHACCHYNQYPGYHGYRPPYSHSAPPPSVYSHGSYPAFPATYPVHSIPSPYFSEDNPRYEYDKHGPRDRHSCGCPNHLCQQKENRNVKIEEQDPDYEKKLSDSLVPSQLKNLPYPIVWIPPGYMMNKEGKITDGLKSREGDKYDCNEKANRSLKSFEQEPSVLNRWLPIDLNNPGSLNQGGDGKRTQHKHNEDMSRNSFPIFWMPHKPEQVEPKEMNGDQRSSEEPLFLRIPPMKLIDSDDRKSQPKALEENSDTEAGLNLVGKNDVPQMIPVKREEPSDKTTILKEVNKKDTVIPVEHKDDKAERRPADVSAKTQSSPPKKSKLPPVCLRVDPFPRRKNNNGSSRSPSPTANKGKSQELLNGSSKSSPSSFMQENNKEDKQSSIHLDEQGGRAEKNQDKIYRSG